MEEIHPTCKVTVTLNQSQYLREEDLWQFTFKGKPLKSTRKYVSWYTETHEDAINSFNLNEVDEYTIRLRTEFYPY